MLALELKDTRIKKRNAAFQEVLYLPVIDLLPFWYKDNPFSQVSAGAISRDFGMFPVGSEPSLPNAYSFKENHHRRVAYEPKLVAV